MAYTYAGGDLDWTEFDLERMNQMRKEPLSKRNLNLMIQLQKAEREHDTKKVREISKRINDKRLINEWRSVDILHSNLIKQEIVYPKKEHYSFGFERKTKSSLKKSYARQKRIGGEKQKTYLGKNLDDFIDKLRKQSKEQVKGENWALYGLKPYEVKIFRFLADELDYRKEDRDPLVEVYIDQLGMFKRTVGRGHRFTFIDGNLTVERKRQILDAARKAFVKHQDICKKIVEVAKNAKIDKTMKDFIDFWNSTIIKPDGKLRNVKGLENYLSTIGFKQSELKDAAREVMRIKRYAFLPLDYVQMYPKTWNDHHNSTTDNNS